MKKLLQGVLAFAMAVSMVACSSASTTKTDESKKEEKTEEKTTIMIAAAASLQKAFDEELIPAFEKENSSITVEGTYASSGDLQTQIEEGLEADLFFSAAQKQMTALIDEDIMDESTKVDLLENKLVLVVPKDSTLGLKNYEDIVNASTIALGDPASVPAGQYAQESLTNLGLWDTVNSKEVSLGKSVTDVLAQVAEGSADCGIVYASDAATNDKVTVVAEAPASSLQTPVVYPLAISKKTKNADAAKKFQEFLTSDTAAKVFEKYGFSIYKAE